MGMLLIKQTSGKQHMKDAEQVVSATQFYSANKSGHWPLMSFSDQAKIYTQTHSSLYWTGGLGYPV